MNADNSKYLFLVENHEVGLASRDARNQALGFFVESGARFPYSDLSTPAGRAARQLTSAGFSYPQREARR